MAKLIDKPLNSNEITDDEEIGSFDVAEEGTVESTTVEAADTSSPTEDDLPEKYKGKSAAEVARMHQELEKRLGQQSQEVGQLRQAFDEMVKGSIKQQNSAPEPQEVDEIDFFTDPQSAVARAIANHPTLKRAEALAVELNNSQALSKLKAAHPDMQEVLSDSGFKEWVGKSQFRQQLFHSADVNYDFAAADELLTLYKERQGVVAQAAKVEKAAQKNEIKKASTGSARSNPEGQTTRKIYRRRDIIELMNRDPKRYEALSDEIMKAYSEGRVR
jgi:hypothetical protein